MSVRLTRLLGVLGGLLLACGCQRAPEPSAAQTTRFRYAMGEAPRSFDPLYAGSEYEAAAVLLIFDSPYRYQLLARPHQLAPLAAAALPEVDRSGLTYTVRLRDDRYFHDHPAFPDGRGRAVTADDLAFSLKRHFDPNNRSRGAWLWQDRLRGVADWVAAGADYDQPLAGIEVLDRHTVRFHLTEPDPSFPYTLTQAFAAIVPREVVERAGADFGRQPIGSGPYRYDAYDGRTLRLAAVRGQPMPTIDLNAEGYDPTRHGGLGLEHLAGRRPPLFDVFEIHYLPDPQTRWAAFEQERVDFSDLPPARLGAVLATTDPPTLKPRYAARWRLRAAPSAEAVFYNFNLDDPALGRHSDPAEDARRRALRCAIARAYDWQARRARFHGGLGAVFGGVIPPAAIQFDPAYSARQQGRDLDAARRLLAESGWNAENLPVLRLGSVGGLEHQQLFEQFRGFMLELGYPAAKIEWQAHPSFDAYVEALNGGRVMLQDLGWGLDTPDALAILQLYYGPNAAPQVNSANYRNPEFDRRFEAARRLAPSAERDRLIAEMNALVTEDCVAISGLARTHVLVWTRRAVVYPDRDFGAAHFLRFVAPEPSAGRP